MTRGRAAAAVIDGDPTGESRRDDRVMFLGRVDGELENGRRRTAGGGPASSAPSDPTSVLGHDPWRRYRLHPDHRAAGFLTLDALVAARDPHFFAELGLPPHRPEALLLFEADLPNHLEDAPGFEETKIDALLCHRSQWESTMGIDRGAGRAPGPIATADAERSFAAKVRRQLADHGSLAGLPAGEAFHLMTDL